MISMSAEIYTTSKQFLYVKLCLDNGVYISGIKVTASIKYPNQSWIQMPAYKSGKNWKRYIEVAGDSEFGKEIYRVIDEVCMPRLFGNQANVGDSSLSKKDDVITVFDLDKPVNLDDIPF